MEDVARQIRDLDHRLDDLESEHESLQRKFGYTEDLDHELSSIRSDIRGCEEKIDELGEELGDRIDDTEQVINRLVQQVRLLEGQLRASSGAPTADLDTFTKQQRDLAKSMESGRRARSLLLSDFDRSTFQHRLHYQKQVAQELHTHRTNVVDSIGVLLASSSYNSRSRSEAAEKLAQALAAERRTRQQLKQQVKRAAEAEEALAADATTRAEKQAVMAAGVRAEQRLMVSLRSRIEDAVRQRAVLPAWFVTVLGSAPPARSTQKWLETAMETLLYRLAYSIDDQVLALGSRPSDTDQRRRTWHDRLLKDLQGW
ncbi:hypothetical protein ACIRP3_42085 [Streptomyces sp. NPDC101209]|uniref:hypothetical protein n=1 Tax=Streptomyces sp. NPDC101209 TaxID=3366129 RepID=UPI0038094B1B